MWVDVVEFSCVVGERLSLFQSPVCRPLALRGERRQVALVCMWVAITVTLAFVHSSSSLQKLCPQFGLYLHAVQPI